MTSAYILIAILLVPSHPYKAIFLSQEFNDVRACENAKAIMTEKISPKRNNYMLLECVPASMEKK